MKATPRFIVSDRVSRRDFLRLSGLVAGMGSMMVLSGCGPSTDSADDTAADDANAASDDSGESTFGSDGQLRVGMEVAYPPYNWQTSEETENTIPVEGLADAYADGIDIYVAKKVAEGFGLEPVAVKLAWSGLIEALTSGQIDCIIAGMTPSDERRQSIDFSDPYYTGHYGLLVRKDSPYAGATSQADLDGATVLGQKDTLLDTVIDEFDNVTHLTPVDSVPSQLSNLNQGACDAITYNVENREGLLAANPDLTAIAFDGNYVLFKQDATCNVGINKGQQDVLDKINDIIAGMFPDEDTMNQTWQEIIARQPA